MRTRAAFSVLFLLLIGFGPEAVRAQVPGAVIPIDFTDPKKTPRKKLTEAGLAWQLPVSFSMLRDSVTLAVKLPEVGQVSLPLSNGEALVEVTTKPDGANKFKIEVRSTLGRMSVEALEKKVLDEVDVLLAEPKKEAAAEAKSQGLPHCRRYLRMLDLRPPIDEGPLRKAFIERRAIELGKEAMLAALEKLVEKRTRWVTQTDQAAWLKASDEELHEEYLRLLALDLAEEHLQKCGFKLDLATRNFDKLIQAKFKGLHAIASGRADSADPQLAKAVRSFTREEMARLSISLTVRGVCEFVPAASNGDQNSQWFNGQRVGTSITGVPSIRAIGRLDSASGDRADWWTLVGYDENKTRLKFGQGEGFRYEIYQSPAKQTCLRIIATRDDAFAYSFELLKRASNGEGQPVVVHESPGNSNATFPF